LQIARPAHHLAPWCPGALRAYLKQLRTRSALERRSAERLLSTLTPLDVRPQPGEAWFPAVVEDVCGVTGLLMLVRTAPLPLGDPRRPLAPDIALSDATQRWVAGLVGVGDPRILNLPSLHVTAPPPGITIQGPSGQLAAAVALLSHLLGLAPREPVLCSGGLGEPGKLAPVKLLEEKRSILDLEAPGQRRVLVGAPRDAQALLARWLGSAWREELEQVLRLSPQALAMEALATHRRDRPLAEAKAREAIGLGQGHTRALAEWVVGACRVHAGQASQGSELMERAAQVLAGEPSPGDAPLEAHTVEELLAFQGIGLLDRLEVRCARDLLEDALARLDALPRPFDRRAAYVALQVAGSLHRARLLDGDLDGAERALLDWNLDQALLPQEEARARADLAELYRRAGRLDEAREQLACARARLRHARSGERAFTGRFQRLFRVRAGIEAPCWAVEPPRWHAWPQPAEVIETLLAGPGEQLDAWLRAHLLGFEGEGPDQVVYLQLALGAVARHAERTGELLPVAEPLVAELKRLLPDIDAGVRGALEALLAADPEGWVRRCPY